MSNNIQENTKYLFGILLPILIPILVTVYLVKSVPIELIWAIIILSIITTGLIPVYIFSEVLSIGIWKLKHKKVLYDSTIGIIKEDGCPSIKIKFKPDDWKNLLEKKYKIKFISALKPSEISDEFIAIINPYGECYPEIDIGEKTSFKRIKEYVSNGGTFVSTAGCAFWYAWNNVVGTTSTAKEVYSYQGPILKDLRLSKNGRHLEEINQIILQPSYSVSPLQSLIETLAFSELGLLTTTGDIRPVKIFQNDVDKINFGDIENLTQEKLILEFRAIRKPTQNFIPILRAKIPIDENNIQFVEIYPLACVPHGKGKFIFAGMMMDTAENSMLTISDDKSSNIKTIDASKILDNQSKMICKVLENTIEKEKKDFSIKIWIKN